jgi:O-acetyl-ADP-ribose deacetylase (regulator of RNase III)
MGKGIALSIKKEFPVAYHADLETIKGDSTKLGSYSQAQIQFVSHDFTVINAYTQFNYRGKSVKANYEAIRSVMRNIKREFSGKRIAYPLIGAGLAGGDWNVIKLIIQEELSGEDHTLIQFDKNPTDLLISKQEQR